MSIAARQKSENKNQKIYAAVQFTHSGVNSVTRYSSDSRMSLSATSAINSLFVGRSLPM